MCITPGHQGSKECCLGGILEKILSQNSLIPEQPANQIREASLDFLAGQAGIR